MSYTIESLPSPENDKGFVIESLPSQQESLPGQNLVEAIPRGAGRAGLRGIETVLGAPRGLGELGEIPAEYLVKGLEKLGVGEVPRKAFETAKKYAPYKLLPKTEQVREFGKNLFGQHFEPKNKTEQLSDDIASDFAALALPIPGANIKPLRSLLASVGANLAAEGVETIGGGPKAKTYTKLGVYGLEALHNAKGVKKFKDELYKKADALLPAGDTVSTTYLTNDLSNIENDLAKGGNIGQSSGPALGIIKEFKPRMQGAQVPVEELVKAKTKALEESDKLYRATEKKYLPLAKRNIQRVTKAIDSAIDLYGKQNPEWYSTYKTANEVNSAIARSNSLRNYILKHGKGLLGSTLGYFGAGKIVPGTLSALGAPLATVPGVAQTGLASYAAMSTAEIASRMAKSPTLRKYYLNVLKNAALQKADAVQENLRKMQSQLEKEYPEETSER